MGLPRRQSCDQRLGQLRKHSYITTSYCKLYIYTLPVNSMDEELASVRNTEIVINVLPFSGHLNAKFVKKKKSLHIQRSNTLIENSSL